jgi:hypothetical protein
MWVSPQGFDAAWMEEFLGIVRARPVWLAGVVYGPQTRLSLPALKAALPEGLPIRHYPDITHTRYAQYPVPDWDAAFAYTQGREPVNPRPVDQAAIFRAVQPHAFGFVAYSEGCNDDVNKIVWSALGWDPDADLGDVLRQYARLFIGPRFEVPFAEGLFALERNWRGPARKNAGIARTLRHFQVLERRAPAATLGNWRFQQALYRAYYDAYVRERLLFESALDAEALRHLAAARRTGAEAAMAAAERTLARADSARPPHVEALRARLFALGDALFASIKMQLSVKRHGAIAVGRGANLDTADTPLGDGPWLRREIGAIRTLPTERERFARLDELARRGDPGPGGFHDDLGDPERQPHLVGGPGFARDPAFFETPLVFFEHDASRVLPRSWRDQIAGLYDFPVRLRYAGLDRGARYIVRVVYAGGPVRLDADGNLVHPPEDARPFAPIERPIPAAATADGALELTFSRAPGAGGAGRGNQIAEVWLLKAPPDLSLRAGYRARSPASRPPSGR